MLNSLMYVLKYTCDLETISKHFHKSYLRISKFFFFYFQGTLKQKLLYNVPETASLFYTNLNIIVGCVFLCFGTFHCS